MAKRIVTKIGDIFCVEIDGTYKVYFQYIANDMSQLNSSVIRMFKRRYQLEVTPKMEEIVDDDVAFYAHTILRIGIEDNIWFKIGKSNNLGLEKLETVWFGSYNDRYYNNELKQIISSAPDKYWWIWHVNQSPIHIGLLTEELSKEVEEGSIQPIEYIIFRIKKGYYYNTSSFFYDVKRVPWDDVNSYIRCGVENGKDTAYLHFLGKNLVSELIVTPTGKIYLDREHPQCGGYEFLDMEFGDINWHYQQFITAEEFNEAWGNHKWQ